MALVKLKRSGIVPGVELVNWYVCVLPGLLLLVFLSNSLSGLSQDSPNPMSEGIVYVRTEMAYEPLPSYSLQDGIKYNSSAFFEHPDFGKLTFNIPHGKNVVEVLSSRTEYERYYVDLDAPVNTFIEKSSRPINMNIDGYWRAIDPTLRQISETYYESGIQSYPSALSLNGQYSMLDLADDAWARFNDFELRVTHWDGTEETFSGDWSEIIVDNFGAYIPDIFPLVDMRLDYYEGSIKSQLIIKDNLNVLQAVFVDHVEFSDGLDILLGDAGPEGGHFVELYDIESSETWGLLRPALTYDSAPEAISWTCDYSITAEGYIEILLDSAHLNADGFTYPVIVDPTFIAVGPITSAFGVNGSRRWGNFCTTNMNVTFPGGSTPWDVQVACQIFCWFCSVGGANCNRSTAYFWITSGCGGASPVGAPPAVWSCPGAPCASPGFWIPTITFGSSGTSSLAQCYAPSCTNQTTTISMKTTRTTCSDNANDICNWATNLCTALDQFTVWFQGKSLETLGDDVTGDGSMTIFDADCAGFVTLDPTPLYGVAPYTYVWSTSATTPTISVLATTSVYTCLVTDACGTTRTATFTISCPLDAETLQLTAQDIDDQAQLKWNSPNTEITEYFEVQRMNESGEFVEIGSVFSNNTDSYEFFDSWPTQGVNYYRLALHHADASVAYSNIAQVDIELISSLITLIPNPSNGLFSVVLNKTISEEHHAAIRDISGRKVLEIKLTAIEQIIDGSKLSAGVYQIEVFKGAQFLEAQKLVVKK